MAADTWYPAQGNGKLDGLWYPKCTNGEEIELGFENAGACMRYLTRSGLAPTGVHMSKKKINGDGPPKTIKLEREPAMLIYSDEFQINPWPTVPLPETAPVDRPPDDRSDWVDIRTMSDTGPRWIRGRCHHRGKVPVESVIGDELLAWWCADCGEQFDPERWPTPEGLHITETLPEIIRPSAASFVDTYADPELIGPEYPKIGIRQPVPTGVRVAGWVNGRPVHGPPIDWDGMFLKIWNGLKTGFRYTWPLWLVLAYYVIGVITK